MQNNLNGTIRNVWTILTALVWLANGLWCKLLNGVPRHRSIVAEILGATYATPLTFAIGALEVLMAIWIISGIRPRLCVILQIVTIATMNVLEYILVPELLLFGRWNALFAALFILALAAIEWTRPAAHPDVSHNTQLKS
jgi:DoxX-like family